MAFESGRPFKVTTKSGEVMVLIKNLNEGPSASFALLGSKAVDKVVIRITGGCKDMGPEEKLAMIDYFREEFQGFKGVIISGGTRDADKEGRISPMVTDVPGVIAAANPGCIALGTAPRTDVLRLVDESRFVLNEWGTGVNPDIDGILLVQKSVDEVLDWNGDLADYFALMERYLKFGGFRQAGGVAWNGGAITEEEIMGFLKRNWPIFIVKGSKRVSDEIIARIDSGQMDKGSAVIVDRNVPGSLRLGLMGNGFMAASI